MMGNLRGTPIHGEAIIDGDASGGIDMILYESGSVTVHPLQPNESIYVTDVQISSEKAADVSLCADGKVAGEYIVHHKSGAADGITRIVNFQQPRACAAGTNLKFYGGNGNLNSCVIEGFIIEV